MSEYTQLEVITFDLPSTRQPSRVEYRFHRKSLRIEVWCILDFFAPEHQCSEGDLLTVLRWSDYGTSDFLMDPVDIANEHFNINYSNIKRVGRAYGLPENNEPF